MSGKRVMVKVVAGVEVWVFFFFSSRRRHTRYWRYWSSDVCSSDLDRHAGHGTVTMVDLLQKSDEVQTALGPAGAHDERATPPVEQAEHGHFRGLAGRRNAQVTSEERRVGKECRSRWWPYPS